MSEIIKEPSDAEFSALLNERAPNRLQMQEPLPEHEANASLLGSNEFPTEPVAPAVVDAPEEVAPAVVEPPAVPEKYAGKTTEELISMHQNLETRLGAQGQELGELRSLRSEFDQLRGAIAERDNQPEPVTQETVNWIEESVLGDGPGTLAWVEKNQPQLYDRAIQTWASFDPFSATRYDTQRTLRAERAAFQAEIESVRQPFAAQQTDSRLQQAYVTVSTNLPGFNEVAEDLPALLEQSPELRVALVNGDLAQQTRILDNLGKVALANRALAQTNDAPATPAEPAGPTQAEVAHAAKVAASVASGSSAGEHGGEAPTKTDKLKSSMLSSGPTSIREELARSRAEAAR